MKNKSIWIAVGVAIVFVGGIKIWTQPPEKRGSQVSVVVPELSQVAMAGKTAFDGVCANCHGKDTAGTKNGPSFLNSFYVPGHHGDAAFVNAIKNGVRAHHWRFGNMPPQPDVTDEQIPQIIAYVREMQRANGIN